MVGDLRESSRTWVLGAQGGVDGGRGICKWNVLLEPGFLVQAVPFAQLSDDSKGQSFQGA